MNDLIDLCDHYGDDDKYVLFVVVRLPKPMEGKGVTPIFSSL